MSVVKLDVIDTIATVVETVPALRTILVSPATPIDRESVIYPAAFLFDEDEKTTERNRLEVGTFPEHIEIWAEGVNVRREMEKVRASIKEALYGSEALKSLSVIIRETDSSHFTVEQEPTEESDVVIGMGGIVLLYEVTYLTKYRDPRTQRNY